MPEEKKKWKDIPPRYMMATKAVHLMGDISSETPSLCEVYGEDEKNYIGAWIEGFGFFDVQFPKDTTRELTEEEEEKWDGQIIAVNGTPRHVVRITPVKVPKESPIIVLSKNKDLRDQLKAKLEEYKGRLLSSKFSSTEKMEMRHRIVILERLLKNGKVCTWEICREMQTVPDLDFNEIYFNKACAIINDYCTTGGANCSGGTGLKKV